MGWSQIGGLDSTVAALREAVVQPLTQPARFNSRLLRAPKGVLLFGPPGCGKTLLARALAKESGASFINLQVSTFMDKWFCR